MHISYVSVIGHDASTPEQLRLTMPTVIAPRYGTPPTGLPIWGPNRGNAMELSVSVHMTQPITAVSSPTHPVAMTLGSPVKVLTGDFQPSMAYIYLHESSTFLEKDVVILISSQKLDHPRCSVERYLPSEGAEETTDAYALTLVPRFNLPPLPGQEYVFLVDRSGSMSGSRITQVKAALQIMLKSLPSKNTCFVSRHRFDLRIVVPNDHRHRISCPLDRTTTPFGRRRERTVPRRLRRRADMSTA